MPSYYDNQHFGTRRVDFLIEGNLLVKLKALLNIEEVHIVQAINYLEAFRLKNGLLLNFGGKSLYYKRLFNNKLPS
mgnify:CR=1 FL=1